MESQNELLCQVYIDSALSRTELLAIIANILSAEIDGYSLEGESFEADLLLNDRYNEDLKKQRPDGFLHYRYLVEFFQTFSERNESNKKAIAGLLKVLWNKNIPAVAACDFEDELPEKGGYKSENVPSSS